MVLRSFQSKIAALMLATLLISQGSMLAALFMQIRSTVDSHVQSDLDVAGSVFTSLFEQRFVNLAEAVRVLANDFGFKGAIGSADDATIRSALSNHAERAGARIALFLPEGGGVIHAQAGSELVDAAAVSRLAGAARATDYAFIVANSGSSAVQLVSAPVNIPQRAGWLVMGFVIDRELALEFRDITGLDITFVANALGGHADLISTLPAAQLEALQEREHAGQPLAANDKPLALDGVRYVSRVRSLDRGEGRVLAILQKNLDAELAGWQSFRERMILWCALLSLLVAAAGIVFSRSMTGPIRTLADAARRIATGNYNETVAVGGADELKELSRTLNGMQDAIADREQELSHKACHDGLTGLPNRYVSRARLEVSLTLARESGQSVSVVVLDLAHFKSINESLGHHVGDVALTAIAQRLAGAIESPDFAARLGGDDFLIIFENCSVDATCRRLQHQVKPAIGDAVELEGMQVQLDFRFGVASFPESGTTAVELLQQAEMALSSAKHAADGIAVFDSGSAQDKLLSLAIVNDLANAMERGDLFLVFQPKIELATHRVCAAEVLMRWIHPVHGFIPPDRVVEVLERTGNVGKLTRWLIERAADQLASWRAKGHELELSVNLSALDLFDAHLPFLVDEVLRARSVPARLMTFEVTESALMLDAPRATRLLHALRTLGHRLSLDDFGTGFSSLSQLKSLPVDELKIDKSFVMQIDSDESDLVIARSTINLAHEMGMVVVAEGVETPAGEAILKELGCEVGQGYLYSRPLKPAEFNAWLEGWQLDEQALTARA